MTEPRSEANRARQRRALWSRRTRFPAFVVSRFISQAGDMAAITALTVYVYASPDSGLAVGALFGAAVMVVCAVPVLRRAGREPGCDQRDPRSLPIT
ncbi:hypothetical protein [Actinophytocola algeriensis]|uniref:Uncharacterized protein n=1 Tax=Actinophytocola algeriensis TaxID=1768010 RepID=A0A7W7VJQ0_9PSEU|nr:hypothetical protein [Actinophytocola algeriensis]MBB4912882.1 hypothetical protein [Actinophytocola algeriensis]MBE1474079.1 hypothetical protein [Actinophytocola algeriensis]